MFSFTDFWVDSLVDNLHTVPKSSLERYLGTFKPDIMREFSRGRSWPSRWEQACLRSDHDFKLEKYAMSTQPSKNELDRIFKKLKEEDNGLKQVVDEMHQDQEKFRALFSRSLHCTYIHDLEGNFLDANDAALDLLGYDKEEALSLNFASLIDHEQLSKALMVLEEIRQSGYQQDFSEYRLKKKDGSYVWIETEGSLIYRKGKPTAVRAVGWEI